MFLSEDSILEATFFNRSTKELQAISTAFPFKSAVELAADGEVLATRVVLVVSIFTLSDEIPSTSCATWSIFVFTPCPISTAAVETPTLPS